MNNLNTLYKYELKKITGRKIFWITLLLCLFVIIFLPIAQLGGKSYVDGKVVDTHYHMFRVDQAHQRALSGRAIDDALLTETMEVYGKIPDPEGRYTLTEEYQTYARPYAAICQLISRWTELDFLKDILKWEPGEQAFYQARKNFLEKHWQQYFLTETEKAFWREKETEIRTPFTYCYHEGYTQFNKSFNTLNLLIQLFAAICLSGVFATEHTRRTDQLILSGAKGKTTVYLAKMLAGITASFAGTALMIFTSALILLGIYGTDGFSMQMQVTLYPFSYPMSIGQASLIMVGTASVLSVLIGIFVMVLSEILHSSIAAMAASTALLILGTTFHIPPQYRIASQIWDWLPFSYLNIWNIFDVRTIPVFGRCLVSWQVVPLLYLLGGALLASIGKRAYRRYQVSGR